MNENKGLLVVVSGPAGSGKGTVNGMLTQKDGYVFSVSATTRAPRPGEVDGVNYHFISREEFESRIERGEMLEYTEYCGNYYGTPKSPAERAIANGKHLLLEIEVDGAMQIKNAFPEAVLVMILPPNAKVHEYRLRTRGSDSEESIQKRLTRTKEELKFADKYDFILLNEDGKAEEVADAFELIALDKEDQICDRHSAVEHYFE